MTSLVSIWSRRPEVREALLIKFGVHANEHCHRLSVRLGPAMAWVIHLLPVEVHWAIQSFRKTPRSDKWSSTTFHQRELCRSDGFSIARSAASSTHIKRLFAAPTISLCFQEPTSAAVPAVSMVSSVCTTRQRVFTGITGTASHTSRRTRQTVG